ncbi:L,D-transpeptidase family protein [Nocardioides pyridinolyticus]
MARIIPLLTALLLLATPAPAGAAQDGVVKAQKRLNELHCSAGAPNGELTARTRSAVVRFQSRAGMAQDAHLTDRTRRALYAEDAPRCDKRPVPAGSGHGRRIVISQHQNWVWLVDPRGRAVAQGGMVDNTRDHQIHADWILGTDMAQSHGCIRLSRALSLKVWNFTDRRTPVRVV